MRFAYSRTPSPHSSTPQLLDTTLRSSVPTSYRAWINAIGTPHRPKPPTARDAPRGMSATASAGPGTTLSITRWRLVAGRPRLVAYDPADRSGRVRLVTGVAARAGGGAGEPARGGRAPGAPAG